MTGLGRPSPSPSPSVPAPTLPMALHHHLSSFCSLVFVHHAEGDLPPPHIQGGIITLQTKHVLLAGQDGLSGEISCRPLCSSWLRILVNCRHRGGHFLPERNLVLSLTSVLLSLVGHLGIPLSSALRALSCQPRVPRSGKKAVPFGGGRGQTDIAKRDVVLPQSSLAIWPTHRLTPPQ